MSVLLAALALLLAFDVYRYVRDVRWLRRLSKSEAREVVRACDEFRAER